MPSLKRMRSKTSAFNDVLHGREETSGLTRAKHWMIVSTFDAPPSFNEESVDFMCFQQEFQPACGRHWQIFLQCKDKHNKKQICDILGYPQVVRGGDLGVNAGGKANRLAYCVARGPPVKAAAYCTSEKYCQACGAGNSPFYPTECADGCVLAKDKGKVGEPVRFGALVEGQKPGRHAEILERVKNGGSSASIIEMLGGSAPNYLRFIDKTLSLFAPKRDFRPQVFWLWGSSGTDKSRLARAIHTDTYCKPPDSRWFDGYDGQPVTIINDLRKMTFTFSYLLDLLDRYPFQVEVKGGYRQFTSRVIVVTCSKSHEELWAELAGKENEHLGQLSRRLTEQVRFPCSIADKHALLFRMRTAIGSVQPESDAVYGTWDGVGAPPSVDDAPNALN